MTNNSYQRRRDRRTNAEEKNQGIAKSDYGKIVLSDWETFFSVYRKKKWVTWERKRKH